MAWARTRRRRRAAGETTPRVISACWKKRMGAASSVVPQ